MYRCGLMGVLRFSAINPSTQGNIPVSLASSRLLVCSLRDVKWLVVQIESELRKDGVVALGEIGLDRSVPERELGRQEEMCVGLEELA